MHSFSDNVLWQLVKAMKLPVSKKILNDYLYTHPNYPSVLSITDTLTELGVDNVALRITKENLHNIPLPFLAHMRLGKGGEFLIIKDKSAFTDAQSDFYKRWSGVIVAAEPTTKLSHKENNEWLQKEKRQQQLTVAAAIVLLAGSAFTLIAGWMPAVITILSLTGIGVALLIVMKELGMHNDLVDSLCTRSDNTDCNTVLQSSASKLFSIIGWSDIGIIYFVSQWSMLLFSVLTGTSVAAMHFFKLSAIASLPFMAFSVFYQWQVAKKWCTMCLTIVSLLFLQMVLLVSGIPDWVTGITLSFLLLALGVMVTVATAWMTLKSLLKKQETLQQELYEALRFKNNVDIFWGLLEKQPVAETDALSYEIELANANAPLQIIMASNPFCRPCANAHVILHELAEIYKDKLSIVVRFSVDVNNILNSSTQAAHIILQRLYPINDPGLARRVLHDWFSKTDPDALKEKYFLKQPPDVSSLLQEHDNWDKAAHIKFTPTIFINGFQLPKEYTIKDLPALARSLVNRQDILVQKEAFQYN